MLQKLYSAEDIAQRYGCSQCTARRYIRQMRHMESPLRVTERDLIAWENGRMIESESVIRQQIAEAKVRKMAVRYGT